MSDYQSIDRHHQGTLMKHHYTKEEYDFDKMYFLLTYYSIDPFGDFFKSVVHISRQISLNAIYLELKELSSNYTCKKYKIDLIYCEEPDDHREVYLELCSEVYSFGSVENLI